jgi:integrase
VTKKINLTKVTLEALPLPAPGKRDYHHDLRVRGLSLCITSKGLRTWYVYRWVKGKPQRVRIGEYPGISIEQARKRAEEINALIASGQDPNDAVRARKGEMTFGDLFAWYLETYAKEHNLSWRRDEKRFENHLAELAKVPLSEITKEMVAKIHSTVAKTSKGNNVKSGVYGANRVLALISGVFNIGIKFGKFAGPNPAKGLPPFREQSRERRLEPSEIPSFLAALEAEPSELMRDFVFISLFTGARRANVLAMRWDEIDFTRRTWRIPMTKNGTAQVLPLGPEEVEILVRRKQDSDSPWVFPASRSASGHFTKPDAGWKRILARAGIKELRIHDLRRSLGSWMVDTGASLPLIGKTLNHQSHQTTLIYARLSLDPVREAKARAIGALLGAGGQSNSRIPTPVQDDQ